MSCRLSLPKQVHMLEAQADFASRDKCAALEALAELRKEKDALISQQSHWDDLRRTKEQFEQLTAAISQVELKELRGVRDLCEVLKCTLRRRYRELKARVASSDHAVSTARVSLAQAQQHAAEWEQRANKNEAMLEEAQAVRNQAEDRAAQLEAERALMRMRLDEMDAKERLAKVRVAPCRQTVTDGRYCVVLGPREKGTRPRRSPRSARGPVPNRRAVPTDDHRDGAAFVHFASDLRSFRSHAHSRSRLLLLRFEE
jgi:hypothetical protein